MPIVKNSGDIKLGILGGGQLALMLLEALPKVSQELGLKMAKPRILASSLQDPACQLTDDVILATESHALEYFFSGVTHATIENEFIDCAAVEASAKRTNTKIIPHLPAILRLQDKLQQKRWLEVLGIPTTPYQVLDASQGNREIVALALKFPKGFVLKWSRFGYDGKGTLIFKIQNPPQEEEISQFLEQAKTKNAVVYAEEFVDFKSELATTACFDESEKGVYYPLVFSEQKNGICSRVWGPATSFGIKKNLEIEAHSYLEKLSRGLHLHGAFSMELFLTKDEKLLVNEIAPRVHNSSHYSMDATECSQFENHLRAVLGLPPKAPALRHPFFGMQNLLGGAKLSEHPWWESAKSLPKTRMHWYGKSENRPLRKMGHINFYATSAKELEILKNKFNTLSGE